MSSGDLQRRSVRAKEIKNRIFSEWRDWQYAHFAPPRYIVISPLMFYDLLEEMSILELGIVNGNPRAWKIFGMEVVWADVGEQLFFHE